MVDTNSRIARILLSIPYARHLGICVSDGGSVGLTVFQLPFKDRFIGNVTLPAYHGGIVATFMQVAALTATYDLLAKEKLPKLIDFSIDYLSSAGPLDLYASCVMHRVGRRVAAVGIRCWQDNTEAPMALGRAHVFVATSARDDLTHGL